MEALVGLFALGVHLTVSGMVISAALVSSIKNTYDSLYWCLSALAAAVVLAVCITPAALSWLGLLESSSMASDGFRRFVNLSLLPLNAFCFLGSALGFGLSFAPVRSVRLFSFVSWGSASFYALQIVLPMMTGSVLWWTLN